MRTMRLDVVDQPACVGQDLHGRLWVRLSKRYYPCGLATLVKTYLVNHIPVPCLSGVFTRCRRARGLCFLRQLGELSIKPRVFVGPFSGSCWLLACLRERCVSLHTSGQGNPWRGQPLWMHSSLSGLLERGRGAFYDTDATRSRNIRTRVLDTTSRHTK